MSCEFRPREDKAVRAARWRKTVRGASLRTRVMAAAALLVALTCLVTAVLGTTLLRSYMLSRSDAQLRDFARVASRIAQRQQLKPGGESSRPQALPTQFLVEVVSVGGQVSMAGGPLGAADGPRLSAVQLSHTGTPFTAAAAEAMAKGAEQDDQAGECECRRKDFFCHGWLSG